VTVYFQVQSIVYYDTVGLKKKTGNEIWPNVNWKFRLSIYIDLCLFDSSISDT
jgi:hypothetical protein